jgi:orotidine-5'-phosphate decarboxylase
MLQEGLELTLIVALDPPAGADPVEWSASIIEATSPLATGYKIGLPLALRAGPEGLRSIASSMPPAVLRIADLKLADIGPIMSSSTEALAEAGYDAVIAHAFTGFEGALDELSRTCERLGVKLIVLLSMSHPAASELMDPLPERFAEIARKARAWGVVVPATRPEIVRRARALLGRDVRILSPGVGVQGAAPGEALCAGADYEIVGRAITRSENPLEAAYRILEEQKNRVMLCETSY